MSCPVQMLKVEGLDADFMGCPEIAGLAQPMAWMPLLR